ncbi:MAG: hypothetical protein V4510_03335 [bacterium]
MAANLAPVYVNDARITLQGDPKPNVWKIIEVLGKQPNDCEVVRLQGQMDVQGKTLSPNDVIDRTSGADSPVYLKCIDRNDPSSAGFKGKAAPAGKFGTTPTSSPAKPTMKGHDKGPQEESATAGKGEPTFGTSEEADY